MAEKKRADEMAREAQREYMRQWRRNNPQKVQEYNRNYWKRRAEKLNLTGGGGA